LLKTGFVDFLMALSVNSLRIGSGDECLLQARLPAGARATSDDSKPSVSNGSGDPRVAALRHVGAPLQRPAFEYRGGASVHAGAIADPAESTGKVRGTILLMPYDTGVNGDRRPSNEWVKRNTSLLVAEALEGEIIGGFRVAVAGLPSKYQHQPQRVSSLIAERDVDAVIAMGYLGRGRQIEFESFAYNVLDNDTPDLLGYLGHGRPIIEEAPDRYRTTLPIELMRQCADEALKGGAVDDPIKISTNAGVVGCNLAFFSVMDAVSRRAAVRNEPVIPAGFIHVPRAPEQLTRNEDRSAYMPFDEIVRGVRASIQAVASTLHRDLTKPPD